MPLNRTEERKNKMARKRNFLSKKKSSKKTFMLNLNRRNSFEWGSHPFQSDILAPVVDTPTWFMARTEPSNISQCVAPSITSRASSLAKDQLQRSDEIKTEFTSREGTYKISALIDNLGKLGTNTCLNEPVKITLLTRLQSVSDPNSSASSSRRSSAGNNHSNAHEHSLEHTRSSLSNGVETSAANGSLLLTDILAFNVGRELVVHEFAEATQVNLQRRSPEGSAVQNGQVHLCFL